jgi:hypothetical protein
MGVQCVQLLLGDILSINLVKVGDGVVTYQNVPLRIIQNQNLGSSYHLKLFLRKFGLIIRLGGMKCILLEVMGLVKLPL